ncbi:M-phase phosphoprotein 6-like [Uloborus diversus]|uniref:M-phase phosphoprotein 6-like n=1 Tax=Uloborus diversus TaxID=327109 RepID=UPI002409D6C7|nr:M-phase phosphoprotein 6-like [Uloborus diversus]
MSQRDYKTTNLSSTLLNLKFMKKSKEKCENDAEEEKRKILFDSEIPDDLIRGGDLCIMEPSFVPCLQLWNGRLSFKGMNPEIEKLMVEDEMKDMDKFKKMDGVSDSEMVQRYTSLIGTVQKKFTPKRKRNVEPEDDVICCSTPEAASFKNKDKRPKFRKPQENF